MVSPVNPKGVGRLPRPGVSHRKMPYIVGSKIVVSRLFRYRDFLLHVNFRLSDFPFVVKPSVIDHQERGQSLILLILLFSEKGRPGAGGWPEAGGPLSVCNSFPTFCY